MFENVSARNDSTASNTPQAPTGNVGATPDNPISVGPPTNLPGVDVTSTPDTSSIGPSTGAPVPEDAAPEVNTPSQPVEDIFSETENPDPGVVLPNMPLEGAPADAVPQPPVLPSQSSGKLKVFIVGFIGVLIIAGGGWYVYDRFLSGDQLEIGEIGNVPSDAFLPPDPVVADPVVDDVVADEVDDQVEPEAPIDTPEPIVEPVAEVIPVAPVDSDSDGLTDEEELSLGTNPQSLDSDADGLTDSDEVKIWKTNPLATDSDGDGFSDGDEVKNGYNPAGPGKLFE